MLNIYNIRKDIKVHAYYLELQEQIHKKSKAQIILSLICFIKENRIFEIEA